MKSIVRRVSLWLALLCALTVAKAQGSPAFQPGKIWLDTENYPINAHGAGFLFDHGTYYWFGEFKVAGKAGNVAHVGISCYSSKDLYHWVDRGIVLPVSHDPSSDIAEGSIIERPKVLHNAHTGKYVLWFHLELKGQGYSAARVGVAIANSPTGPYTYLRSFRPDGAMSRDMTLFQDDDGKAYLITASEDNNTMHVSQLTDDFLGTDGNVTRIFIGRQFEAPAIFKRQGRYYFVGSHCTGWAPNPAVSAVAPTIRGPWKILGNPAQGPDADTTFHSQSTYVLPVAGMRDSFIFIADRWDPENAINGRYIWLPIRFQDDHLSIRWQSVWTLREAFTTQSH